MQSVLNSFSNLAGWQAHAESLYWQLPSINAQTKADDEQVVGALIRFYITHLLPDNGLFPEELGDFINASDQYFLQLLRERLTQEDPLGIHAPKYMQRKASNIQATYWMSLHHLATSLIEESHARLIAYEKKGQNSDYKAVVTEILAQQFMAYDFLSAVSEDFKGDDFEKLQLAEIESNKEVLSIIGNILGKTDAEMKSMHREITNTWGMLTAANPLVTPDFNYRTYSMRVPGASRSLFPYPVLPMHAHSSPLANYVTYAEVPQASSINGKDIRSFGFLNAVLFDRDTGESLIVERPHYMHSTDIMQMAAEVPGAFEDIFRLDEKSRQNHDLLHHLVQIFGEHFKIHHPSAPISRHGYLSAYFNFGRDMRAYRETYELTAGAGHADIFAVRGQDGHAPQFYQDELALIDKACKAIHSVKQYLVSAGRDDDAQRFVDYTCRAILGPEFFVVPLESPERKELEAAINAFGVSPAKVRFSDVVGLLDSQRLLAVSQEEKLAIIGGILESQPHASRFPNILNLTNSDKGHLKPEKYAEYVNGAFYSILPLCSQEQLSDFYATAKLEKTYPECEFGAEMVVATLQEFGLIKPAEAFPVELYGSEAVRWNLLGAKTKPGLTGFAEKVHHMNETPFGQGEQVSVFDLIEKQYVSLQEDRAVYDYRMSLHKSSQRAAHALLGLFSFTHENEDNPLPNIVRTAYETGINLNRIGHAVGIFDELIDHVFHDRFCDFIPVQKQAFADLKAVLLEQPISSLEKQKYIRQIDKAQSAYEEFQRVLFTGVNTPVPETIGKNTLQLAVF